MALTYEELKKMTVAQLRELASSKDHPALKGYSQLKKEHLFQAVCQAFGVEKKKKIAVKVQDKGAVKKMIRNLKARKEEAMQQGNSGELKEIRRKIRFLNRKIKKLSQNG